MAPSKKKQKQKKSSSISSSISTRGSSVGSKGKKAKPAPKPKAALKAKPKTKTNADAVATNRRSTANRLSALPSAFKPIEDRVLLALEARSETTAGGIIIPGNVESRPQRGVVLAKGPGRRGKKGQIRPLDVNVGDHVLFPEHSGSKIQIGGEDFLILREDELLGIVTA